METVKEQPDEKADKTPSKEHVGRADHLKPFCWEPGKSGNPAGRPKGSRNKLAEHFIQDIYEDWKENGVEALVKVRTKKPDVYLRVVADLIPSNMKIEVTPLQKIVHQIIDVPVKEATDIKQLDGITQDMIDSEGDSVGGEGGEIPPPPHEVDGG